LAYDAYRTANPQAAQVKPCLFVVAASIEHCGEVGQVLAGPDFIGDPSAVLEITSESSDEALAALAAVEAPDSRIRAIVSVNKLREGWDVRNIAVIVALRRLASQSLTEQILGRGLRLPFGTRTGVAMVDQVDLVAHDSYRQLLAQKDVLLQRMQATPSTSEVDETGAATNAGEGVVVPSTDVPVSEQPEQQTTSTPSTADSELTSVAWQDPEDEDSEGEEVLIFEDDETRQARKVPVFKGRVENAPQVVFPRREARLTYAAFTLSDIPNGDAEAAGARFVREVPSFLQRDALEVTEAGDVRVSPQAHVEAQQALTGIDTIRADLASAILRQVTETREEKNAARRLVKAFLKGAGVTDETQTATWGENRRQHAISGIADLIRSHLANRKREMKYELVSVTLPIEPVGVDPSARDAYSDEFAKHVQFVGFSKNVMPVATFDAGSTEWALAHLLDRDPDIVWWLRIYTNGPAFIPTEDGNYFPDFIALDKAGAHWVIEGKSDKNANDADVLRKREAAEKWARSVNDSDEFGEWHYVFAAESHIKAAGGSWEGLKVVTNPE
jgi:type III restriction enzyme